MFVAAFLKTAFYLGSVLLLGAGLFRYRIGPELAPTMARTLKLGVWVGTIFLVAASLGDLTWSVTRLLGRWDTAFIGEYALYTTHGCATLIRLGLVAVLLFVSLKPFRFSRWLLIPLGLALLATFSVLSHAAAMHGAPALLADLAHFTAATLWGGAILYTALSPAWQREPAEAALLTVMARVSSLGLGCVALLAATGVYASLLHLARPAELTGTPYGLALVLKLALVGTILLLAALNRWWLLPALRDRYQAWRLGRALKLEALLLLGVFAATGLLTTRPLPHS
jgi:putative copper export protein